MKRGLVVSGGGSKIAWAGGIIEYLIKQDKNVYDVISGTSAGSLTAPFVAMDDIDKLKKLVLSVDNNSIYKVCPFDKNGKIKIANAIWRLARGKSSLGDGSGLYDTLRKSFTLKDFEKIQNNKKDVLVTCVNYNCNKTITINIKECNYDEFCKYLFASCSVPIVFDFVEINGQKYLDGGVTDVVPLDQVVKLGCSEIDVIILRTKSDPPIVEQEWNMFDVASRTIGIMNDEISKQDISIGVINAGIEKVKINLIYLPYNLTNNSVIFTKKEMEIWWQSAYWNMLEQKTPCYSVVLNKNGSGYYQT